MEEEDKLPLKRVELSLTKFNEVAIPHHLDLLRQHKANIIKYEAAGAWARVRAEQTSARRVAAQLRALLAELDALRRRVREADVLKFDARTRRARDLTHRAVMDYLGVIERSCIALVRAGREPGQSTESAPMAMERARPLVVAGSAVSTDSVGVVAHVRDSDHERRGSDYERRESDYERRESDQEMRDGDHILDLRGLTQLQIDEQEADLREREAVLRGWKSLQLELRALHDAWQCVQAAALAHRDHVAAIAADTEVAADNVKAARSDLAVSERLRAGAWGAGGALAGALAGGPLGLVVGAKAGAAAALVGSAAGFLAARLLGRRRRAQIQDPQDAQDPQDPHDPHDPHDKKDQ